jgi:hypothetical protein
MVKIVCMECTLANPFSVRTVRFDGPPFAAATVAKSRVIADVSSMPGHTSYCRQPHLHDRPHVSLNGLEPSAVKFNSGKSNATVNCRSIVSTEGKPL